MQDAMRIAATLVVGLGLVMILWRELSAAGERRTVGQVRDTLEVLLPVLAAVALLVLVWVA